MSIGGVPAIQWRAGGVQVFDEQTRADIGAYELTDVALSLPTLVSRAGAGKVLEVPLAVNELLGLQASAKALDETRQSLNL